MASTPVTAPQAADYAAARADSDAVLHTHCAAIHRPWITAGNIHRPWITAGNITDQQLEKVGKLPLWYPPPEPPLSYTGLGVLCGAGVI